ncbi:MAG: nitrile hydratase subunit beta [Actinomycetia bacterium]|nr:nitrile hydratase subunit beta [Actinomycetes bacterium]
MIGVAMVSAVNEAHDMGGTHGRWNLDQARLARENVPAGHYLSRSYYEMWLDGSRPTQSNSVPRARQIARGRAQTPSSVSRSPASVTPAARHRSRLPSNAASMRSPSSSPPSVAAIRIPVSCSDPQNMPGPVRTTSTMTVAQSAGSRAPAEARGWLSSVSSSSPT